MVLVKSHHMVPKVQKDAIPAINLSNLVYEFTCVCDARYVGKTSQRLVDSKRQHVPVEIRKGTDWCNGGC